MNNELPSVYDPKQVENKIYQLWEKSGYFNPDKLPKRYTLTAKRYSIFLPPPNITGSLHMGHALNATIQDILIRYHRMKRFRTIWFPGTDHAGIATQNVVEKQLKKEGLTRWALGREKFIKRVWQWKEKYGNIILGQLKQLGASCDWSRTRFTLDSEYSKWVQKAFVHYWEKGLIYRGKKVINWCPRCQTSLSDLEIEYKEEKTKLWYIRYPLQTENSKLKTQNYIVVATTRPETMLGDAAVAVNPEDDRYKNLIGKKVILPIQNREIPIISDEAVDPRFGTGAVKVTPAHSVIDSEIAERHKLTFYEIINERGLMTGEAGKICEGLKTLACREKVIQELKKLNLIEKIEDYSHNLSLCYRCETPIEPLLSNQWFVRMKKLADKAVKAVKSGRIKIVPKKFEKIYFNWLNPPVGGIRDWCISRQIWWGHRLPVFFCRKKQEEIQNSKFKIQNPDYVVSPTKPNACPFCKKCAMEQSEDVLDTWFSSALWPFAGLNKKDLKDFYPSSILVTGRDIINLWVGRMIFSGLEFIKKIPFPIAFIHATILSREGKRMSKSLGTGVDPLELIEKYGADATRFGIIWQAMGNQDIHWDETAVLAGKKFANKIWNAARFILINKPPRIDMDLSKLMRIKNLTEADKKILNELKNTKQQVEKYLKNYEFGQALHMIYDFFWHNFCDIYIEVAKKQLTTYNLQLTTKTILLHILFESLKMSHPFMPFITEEIYQKLPIVNKKLLIIEQW